MLKSQHRSIIEKVTRHTHKLLNDIVTLENRIDDLERTSKYKRAGKYKRTGKGTGGKGTTGKGTGKGKNVNVANVKKTGISTNDMELCVYPTCPKGTGKKNKVLFGHLKVGGGSLCTFHKCPAESIPVGYIDSGGSAGHLCAYKKCPGSSHMLDTLLKSD